MRRLVLHIGTHKTGTTSIQKALARNRAALAARGVLYPLDVLGSSRHDFNELATELRRDGEAGADLWRRTLAACRDGTAMLSGEAMRRLGDDDVERIGQWTKDFNVHVLIYLRNVFDYLASAYKQRIKSGSYSNAFDVFVHEQREAVDYAALIARWERVFGAESVDVRLYDRVRKEPGIVRDALGVVGAADLAPPDEDGRANVSPGDRTIAAMRAVNRIKRRTIGAKRRSKFFRLLRDSASRRSWPWRVVERLMPAELIGPADRDVVSTLVAGLGTDALETRFEPEEIDLLHRVESP